MNKLSHVLACMISLQTLQAQMWPPLPPCKRMFSNDEDKVLSYFSGNASKFKLAQEYLGLIRQQTDVTNKIMFLENSALTPEEQGILRWVIQNYNNCVTMDIITPTTLDEPGCKRAFLADKQKALSGMQRYVTPARHKLFEEYLDLLKQQNDVSLRIIFLERTEFTPMEQSALRLPRDNYARCLGMDLINPWSLAR